MAKNVQVVRATAHLKRLKEGKQSVVDIVQSVFPEISADDIKKNAAARKLFLEGRIRFDITMMLVMRHLFPNIVSRGEAVDTFFL